MLAADRRSRWWRPGWPKWRSADDEAGAVCSRVSVDEAAHEREVADLAQRHHERLALFLRTVLVEDDGDGRGDDVLFAGGLVEMIALAVEVAPVVHVDVVDAP